MKQQFKSNILPPEELKSLVCSLQREYTKSNMDKFIAAMHPFICSCAKKFSMRMKNASSDHMEDLISIGIEQLFSVIRKYNPESGPVFPYARQWIREYMRKYQKRMMSVLFTGESRSFNKIFKKIADVSHLSESEQLEQLDVTLEELNAFKLATKKTESILKSFEDDQSTEEEFIASKDPTPEIVNGFKDIYELSNRFRATMNPRERFIWDKFCLLQDISPNEMAKTLGLSRERTRQILLELKLKFKKVLEKYGITEDSIEFIYE